ncbi:MAG: PKD domain-containing protein [Candidatus Bipolaricaulia bacterium]
MSVVVFAVGFSCWADVEISVVSADQEVAPGGSVTPVFAVANSGVEALALLLEFEAPIGWDVFSAQDSLSILPGEESTLFATVAVPSDVESGDYELIAIAVFGSEPEDRSAAIARIRVEITSEIELTAPDGESAAPGETVEYQATLTNRGNAQESVLVAAGSSRQFAVDLAQTVFDLTPGEHVAFKVLVEVPVNADPGQDTLTLTATSTLYDGVEDEVAIVTTILPPTPDSVGVPLMEILPARLRISFDQDVFTGDFSSRLTFSTSGRVLDGFFSSFVSTSSPFGPDPFDVTSYSILYRREPATTTLGNVSKRLSDLVSLTCEGGSFEVDDEILDLIVVAGLSGDEARFGGRFALGPETANVGLTYFEGRSPTARRAIGGMSASAEPIEDWQILIEAALGTDDGLASHAFLFATEINTEGFFLRGDAFSIGTDFPGAGSDSAGISLSQRLRMIDFSLSLSLSHEWDNVIRDPLTPTRIDDAMGFNISATPFENGPRLSSTVEFEWSREDDPTQMSDIDLLVSAGIRETGGVFPYSFTGEISDRIDRVLGTHTRALTFSEGAGLSVDSFYLFLQLTQEKTVDVVNDLVLSGGTDVSFLFRPEGTLHEASVSLRNTVDSFDLSASIFVRFIEGLDIVFDGTIGWDRADATPVSFGWGISFSADLVIPLPFLITSGRIEGRLFVDEDGDRAYGPADAPVKAAVISANGAEVSTDRDGLFRFPPLSGGTYSLSVAGLPQDAVAPPLIDVRVVPGETSTVLIPLKPVLVIEGAVFDDVDQNAVRGADEGGFSDVRVLLVGEPGTLYGATTDASGQFSVVDVLPGRYTASLDPASLPVRFSFTTPETVTIDVSAERSDPLAFGGYIRPREVIITFQPPTADFSHSPEEPTAGDPVTFDGTLSFDFDGEIVAYDWDFDGDSLSDATGSIVEWSFLVSGDIAVSLTVTDDTGNQDSLTRPVVVSGASSTAETVVSSFQPPIADFSFTPEKPTVGDAVAFDGSLAFDFDGEIVAFDWDFDGDGVIDATGPAAQRIFLAAGTYEVGLSVTDDGGNTDTLVQTVEVLDAPATPVDVRPTLQPPTASFSYTPGQPIAGEPTTFDGTSSSDPQGEIVSYAWDFDADGLVDETDTIVEYAFPVPGSYAVSLTVVDAENASDTVTYILTVDDSASADESGDTFIPPIAEFAHTPTAPIAGEPVEFNGMFSFDADGEIAAYAWDFDGNGVTDAGGPIVLHVYGAPGSYDVRLTVTDDDGNTDTLIRTIAVN